jgi:AFG3 family protein
MKDEEQEITVAYHEVGHAIVGWFLKGGSPLLKLTIKPRSKGALGFAQYLPSEIELKQKQDLLDQIACILGGRAAEEVFRGCVTTGAYDDFQKANKIAQDIIGTYALGDSLGTTRCVLYSKTAVFK